MAWGGSRPEGPGALVLAACALLLPAAASGQGNGTVSPFVEEKILHDDNVFRLSPGVDPVPVIGTSARGDTHYVTSAGLNLDLPVGRQRLLANFSVSDSRYRRFRALNHTGHDLRAAWLWQMGNDASGQLGYSDSSTLASFANIAGTAPDRLKLRQAFFNGSLLVTPRWRLQAAANIFQQRNSDSARQANDVDIGEGEIGLSYVTPAGTALGLNARAESGSFPNRQSIANLQVDNAYRQHRIGPAVDWPLTAASRLSGRIERLSRRYAQLPQRDYHTTTARLQYEWKPTGKTSLSAIAQRDLSPFEYVRSGFVLVKGLTLQATYGATAKLDISAVFDAATREYLGDPAVALGLAAARIDQVRSAGVLVAYRPLDSLNLQLRLQREIRSSNIAFGDYQANVVTVSARLAF